MRRPAALALALALVLTAAAPASALAQHALVGLPLTDPAYTQLDGLMRQGCAAARVSLNPKPSAPRVAKSPGTYGRT